MEVRKERTGWRDSSLSERHRKWGWDCPALDLDFLMLEYDSGKASALVEFKNEHAATQHTAHPSYRALSDLGTRAHIPVFAARYADDFSWFKVVPLNELAAEYLKAIPQEMTEKEWVELLYKTRNRNTPEEVIAAIQNSREI